MKQSTIIVGELKQAREALDAHYRAFITYINAVQEIQPEEQISQAAQFYNQDIKKIDEQIAQSCRKKKSEDVEPESAPDEGGDDGSDVTPVITTLPECRLNDVRAAFVLAPLA